MSLKEYVVTSNDIQCKESLCAQMEEDHGNDCVPQRKVKTEKRFKKNRITTFLLHKKEAEALEKDPRVKAVEPVDIFDQHKIAPAFEQSGNFKKNYSDAWASDDYSWSLLRCTTASTSTQLAWGLSSVTFQNAYGSSIFVDDPIAGNDTVNETVQTDLEGKNVDVVILDQAITDGHPELKENFDGSGSTRFVEYNWFQHNPDVTGDPVSNYVYDYDSSQSQFDHGISAASAATGSSCGFARKSNVYNLCVFPNTQGSTVPGANVLEVLTNAVNYIREFHENKFVNPQTGRINPTLVNASISITTPLDQYSVSDIDTITFNGVSYNGPFTVEEARAYGVSVNDENTGELRNIQTTSAAYEALMEDLIEDGIIVVTSAGNDDRPIYDASNSSKYNSFISISSAGNIPHMRYSTFNHAAEVITVGAISFKFNDRKSSYSQKGERVDLFAPADGIKTATWIERDQSSPQYAVSADPRDSNYYFRFFNGTSASAPVVTGILACALEAYPWMSQTQAKEYITSVANENHITDEIQSYSGTGAPITNWDDTNYGLWGAPNKLAKFRLERGISGKVYPIDKYFLKKSAGMTYPKRKIRSSV